jgi:hypothetical protein
MATYVERLADLRLALADARAELRIRQDYWHSCRLRTELALGEKVEWDTKRLGSNKEDRERAFGAAVEADVDCINAQSQLRATESRVGRLAAELDSALDERRDREWAVRERSITVMGGLTGSHDVEQYGLAV